MFASNKAFKVEIPQLHPLSASYLSFWREQKQRCIEGYWVGGTYMPPALYFYINFGTIKKNVKPHLPKTFARPDLRDIDWELFRLYTEARGFSGFELDEEYTSHRALLDPTVDDELLRLFYPSTLKSDGTRKTYRPARDALFMIHPHSLGKALFENQIQNFMVMGSRNFGKALHNDEILYTEDSTIRIGDVTVGTRIYGADGSLTTVRNVYPQGQVPLYEVVLRDGRKIRCCENHLWTIQRFNKIHTLSTKQLLDLYKTPKKNGFEYNCFIPKISSLEFHQVPDLPIDPYTLGVLLGDGSLTQAVSFTTNDPEIIEHIPYKVTKWKGKYAYGITGLHTYIDALNLCVKSEHKHIPKEYLRASKEQRLALLQGLMDTDGYVSKTGNIEFSTSSSQLCKDVMNLIRSLGINCSSTKRSTTHLDNYRVHIYTSDPIFRVKRKLQRLSNTCKSKHLKTAIVEIHPVEEAQATCIEVDNSDRLFITTDYVPTHNSYSVGAGIIPHNFLFDGATSYDEHTINNPATVEILVGAEESSRSRDLLSKTKESFDFLPGKIELNHRTYPSPFSKQTIGSMEVNRDYVAAYKKRDPGGWTLAGSKSAIKHRSFNANPFAAQGTRPLLLVLEEIGLFSNLKEAYYHSVDALRSGTTKSGMLFMIGTGGDMGKGTLHAQEMFYSPEKFEILSMPNTFEPNGKGEIAYFVPAYLTLGPEYRDAELNTKVELAKAYLMQQRDKKRTDKGGSQALNMEMQYRPFVPSEMFLSRTASIFPSAELRRRASEVLAGDLYSKVEKRVSLFFDPTTSIYNGVNYEIDDRLEPITSFPTPEEANKEGAVVVYELPYVDPQTTRVPQDAYIIGCDPFKEDNPMKGGSLAAIYVVKTSKHFNTVGHDEIVASYVGRPYAGKNAVNEILYKLSLFYGNAKIYFENSVGNVKDYFEKQKRLDLLASQPTTIFNRKASYATPQSVIYGYPMSNDKIKWEAIQYLRSWLLEERDPETHVRNLDLITDPALLQELLAFDMDGNFDRVMSLTGCIIGLEEFHNHSKRRTENENANSALNIEFKSFIVNNKNLFNVSTSTPLLPSQSR